MLTEYQLNPAFTDTKEIALAYQPTPEIDTNKLPILPDAWLDDLQKIICQADNKLPKNIFDNHVGGTSDYHGKIQLLKQLQLISHRLQGNLDAELGKLLPDNRQALISKLTEEITQCSEGFHNRVNIIVDSFHKPRNLAELLCIVRKNLVEKAAAMLTNEVHAWNRVSIIAANDGLGIKVNFPDDTYVGALSDISIRRALQHTFHKQFTPYHLPCLLITAFMEFIPELEIEKNQKNGISLQMREKIIRLIRRFLPNYINEISNHTNNWQKYFIVCYDTTDPSIFSFVNIDWEKMYRSFYNALSAQKYFKTPQINTLTDCAYYNLFLRKKSSHNPADLILKLFKSERHAELLEQLVELNARFPSYYKKKCEIQIAIQYCLPFIDYLTGQLKISNEYSKEIMQGFHFMVHLNFSNNKSIIGKIADTFLVKNLSGFNPLMLAALNSPGLVKDILSFLTRHEIIIASHNPEIPKKIFLMKNKANLNVLKIAVMYHSETVEMILEFIGKHIQDLDNSLLQEFFLEKQANNYNVLMLAASKQAEAIVTILNFLTIHIGRFANDTLRNLFTQQQKDSYTAVTLTARDHPDRIQNILSFITNHIKIDGETLHKLLFTENSNTCMALMLAVKNKADATYSILKFISENIKSFDPKILVKMFLEKDQNGFTILMLAARYQPKALGCILEFIDEHDDFFPAESLPTFFVEKNPENYNCLMLAAEYQPICVPTILNFTHNKIESFKPDLEKILFTSNKEGCNSLMLARHHPIAMTSIINFIHVQPEGVISVTLEQIFLEKHQLGFTFLMLTARDYALSLNLILNFFHNNPKIFTRESLIQIFSETNELDYNSFMLAVRNLPDAANYILSFIEAHPTIFRPEFITQFLLSCDKNNHSTLMIAARYQPEAVELILNFIQTQPKIFLPTFINELLLTHDQYGVNALMIAATYQTKAVELLLSFVTRHIKYMSNDAIQAFVFKNIRDREAAAAVFFGGRYDYKKSVLSVTTQCEDPTAVNALLSFIDDHINLLGTKVFANLLKEKDNKNNYIFRSACSKYPRTMKNVLNFIANSSDSEDLIPLQDLSAYFIFEQFARWSIESHADQALLDKVISNCSAPLLIYFNKDYFAERPINLKIVTGKLFSCYIDALEDLKAKKVNYTAKFSFFKWRCSTLKKLEAAYALEKVLDMKDFDKEPAFLGLKKQYWAFSESESEFESILSYILTAYQKINRLTTESTYDSDLQNDAVHLGNRAIPKSAC